MLQNIKYATTKNASTSIDVIDAFLILCINNKDFLYYTPSTLLFCTWVTIFFQELGIERS